MPSPLSLEPDTLCSSETGAKLVGIVTSRDMRFESPETPLHKVMTTSLVTAPQGVTRQKPTKSSVPKKKGKLPIIDEQGCLTSLLARSDFLKNQNCPLVN